MTVFVYFHLLPCMLLPRLFLFIQYNVLQQQSVYLFKTAYSNFTAPPWQQSRRYVVAAASTARSVPPGPSRVATK